MGFRHGGWRLLGLGITVLVGQARADRPVDATVWFRSSEGCPDGASFVARIVARSARARLATAGDRIDFVVTLGATARGFEGRVERQTAASTIAIRELEGESCDKLAEALALSVVLALDPNADAPARTLNDSADVERVDNPYSTRTSSEDRSRSEASTPIARAPSDAGVDVRRSHRPRWAIVGQATLSAGVAPDVAPGAAALAEYAIDSPSLFSPAFRFGVAVTQSSSTTAIGALRLFVAAARLEGCPLAIRADAVRLQPCLGMDAGMIRTELDTEAGAADTAFWSAARLGARVGWLPAETWILELEADGQVPLTRYEVGFGSRSLHQTAEIGLLLALGVGVRLP